ncbi:MAG: YibE/F family protein [Candidatus Dojkabacteria bacterium]
MISKILRKIFFFCFLIFFALSFSKEDVFAQEYGDDPKTYKGQILESIVETCEGGVTDSGYICVKYRVKILDGDHKDEEIESLVSAVNNKEEIFKNGKDVYVSLASGEEFGDQWNVESYSREKGLAYLFVAFIVLILLITGSKGAKAIVGLIFSFAILYLFAIPNINMGSNIILISLVSILLLLIASTFVTYGFNKKSLIAFISSSLGIFIIFVLGYFVVKSFDLHGTGEESAFMLYDTVSKSLSLSSIYLLGIVIGALGVLDDVTVGQTSSMMEIYRANQSLTSRELYTKAMNIGKDHIASMINTLFIAYAGSSFTLVMLLSANSPDFRILINTEFVVEVIVRTLVASIGLILVVPLTTYIASHMVVKKSLN